MRYRVKAAACLVKTWSAYNPYQNGPGIAHLYQGQLIPEDVDEKTIRHLLDSQIIEPLEPVDDLPPAA